MTNPEEQLAQAARVPILFLDLDGTVRKGFDELGRWVNGPEDVELFAGMKELLASYKQAGWRIVGVTNQGGVALGHMTMKTMQAAVVKTYELAGEVFDLMMACRHHPDAADPEYAVCFCRKPRIGMLVQAQLELSGRHNEIYPPHLMLMVGDREEDKQCAANAGIKFMWAAEWRTAGAAKGAGA